MQQEKIDPIKELNIISPTIGEQPQEPITIIPDPIKVDMDALEISIKSKQFDIDNKRNEIASLRNQARDIDARADKLEQDNLASLQFELDELNIRFKKGHDSGLKTTTELNSEEIIIQ